MFILQLLGYLLIYFSELDTDRFDGKSLLVGRFVSKLAKAPDAPLWRFYLEYIDQRELGPIHQWPYKRLAGTQGSTMTLVFPPGIKQLEKRKQVITRLSKDCEMQRKPGTVIGSILLYESRKTGSTGPFYYCISSC
jgi:hypothetical protein